MTTNTLPTISKILGEDNALVTVKLSGAFQEVSKQTLQNDPALSSLRAAVEQNNGKFLDVAELAVALVTDLKDPVDENGKKLGLGSRLVAKFISAAAGWASKSLAKADAEGKAAHSEVSIIVPKSNKDALTAALRNDANVATLTVK